jgi:thiol-disulfide isomerase/thioredoxin
VQDIPKVITAAFLLLVAGCQGQPTGQHGKMPMAVKSISKKDTAFGSFRIDTSLQFSNFEAIHLYRAKLEQAFFDHTKQILRKNPGDQQLAFTIDSFRFNNQDLYTSLIFRQLRQSPKTQQLIFYLNLNSDFSKLVTPQQRVDLFQTFPAPVRNSAQGKKMYAELINRLDARGKTAGKEKFIQTAFLVENTLCSKVQLQQLLPGGYNQYLLVFGASWCSPCRYENRLLKKKLAGIDTLKTKIIAISIDTDRNKWLKAVQQDECPWVQVRTEEGMESAVSKYFGLDQVPMNILLDGNKDILEADTNIERILEMIQRGSPEKNG